MTINWDYSAGLVSAKENRWPKKVYWERFKLHVDLEWIPPHDVSYKEFCRGWKDGKKKGEKYERHQA